MILHLDISKLRWTIQSLIYIYVLFVYNFKHGHFHICNRFIIRQHINYNQTVLDNLKL